MLVVDKSGSWEKKNGTKGIMRQMFNKNMTVRLWKSLQKPINDKVEL